MAVPDRFTISSIFGAEIIGPFKSGHGQIGSLGDAQKAIDASAAAESPAALHKHEEADIEIVRRVFLELREVRGDRGSPDLYVADSERNAAFLAKCRAAGLEASPYVLNKTLMNARRDGLLPDLNSVKTSIDYDAFAFAVEFAARDLDYRRGATIDDLLCDPGLSAEFEAIARRIAPGHTSFEYRWAILSIRKAGIRKAGIRKAGRHANKSAVQIPELTESMRLLKDSLDRVPETSGVYLLYEKARPLYAKGTEDLRHGIELHRQPQVLEAFREKLWQPDLDGLVMRFAQLPLRGLWGIERKIIEVNKPLFNVERAAA
jgi:hypothetical protein